MRLRQRARLGRGWTPPGLVRGAAGATVRARAWHNARKGCLFGGNRKKKPPCSGAPIALFRGFGGRPGLPLVARWPAPLQFGNLHQLFQQCRAAEREERDSERAAPSVTARCFATTSRVSPSRPSAVWLAVAASSASLA